MDALERLGIAHLANRQIRHLSGGQQQRLFIARSLLQDAEIYLLDEPFAGVDLMTERAIVSILKRLKNKGKTVLVVHHDLNSVEAYFDMLVILKTSLIAYGNTCDVFNEDNLACAFGKRGILFDEAYRLKKEKSTGLF